MSARSVMELREQQIRSHYPHANALISGFEHAPRIARDDAAGAPAPRRGLPGRRAFRSTTPGLVTSRPASGGREILLEAAITAGDDDDPLLSPRQATVLRALRRAIATAEAMAELFAEQSDLARLKRLNLEGRLPAGDSQAFAELLAAASLVALHVFANMSAFLLARDEGEGEGGEHEVDDLQEILTDGPGLALKGALWELERLLRARLRQEGDLVPLVQAFAERLMEEAETRGRGAPRLEGFLAVSYRVEADDFQIDGFTPALRGRARPLVMSFKKPHEVVGNHIAKYQGLKLAKMLMAYDFGRQLNPFAELGGFIFTFLGDGKPGTGKTTLIQMLAGLLNDYCANAGYPFRYANLSSEAIDSYQGKSAQNAKAFIRTVMDPHVIGFGTIDDIDQIAGRRGDRQSSAGQQEITAVLMESFAGASTVVRGNCTFGMFSNFPENVDEALRQRAAARFLVDGPRTREDYVDILHLLLGRDHGIPVGEHEPFAAQEIRKAVQQSYEAHDRPREEALAALFEETRARIGELDTVARLGHYLKEIAGADPRFTGRAVKNITDAVKVRAMDFELPDEWMERPDLFLFRSYEEKRAMIAELMQPITPRMVIQEINRYADSEFRYAGTEDAAAIEAMVTELRRSETARRRFARDRNGEA